MNDNKMTKSQSEGPRWPGKVDLFGVQVSCVDYDSAVSCIVDAACTNRSAVIACHAVHAIVTASGDDSLRAIVNRFAMITPDGQPVRWALNWLYGAKLSDRVYGPELMLRVCQSAATEEIPIYLYGGTPSVLEKLQTNLRARMPRLKIAGAEAPPFRPLTEEENAQVVERIHRSQAKIVLIGLGCPKQDLFAGHNADRIQAVQMCVGAAFDFHAGVKPIAPAWMQKFGLEWLFRLRCEPRRLWRRYLVTNSVFLAKLAAANGKRWRRPGREPTPVPIECSQSPATDNPARP